jgi:alpha-tubulin suppressor-like RCC1 family protein
MVLDSGRVFTWGTGTTGQLGHGDCECCDAPRLLESLQDKIITQVAASNNQTAVVSSDGELYHWGAPQPDHVINAPEAIMPFGRPEQDATDRYVS